MKPRRVALLRCLVAPFACTAIFAPACVSTAAGAAMAAASAGTGAAATRPVNYQVTFKAPWKDDESEGLQHLEHVNVCVPDHGPAKQLYYDVLGFVPDRRRAQNIGKGSGTIWANAGTTQIHLPEGDPQVVPGTIGLVYSDLAEVLSRLKEANRDALDGTKFTWRLEGDGIADVTCPYGNVFRLHKRTSAAPTAADQLPGPLDPRGGRLLDFSGASLGLGIAYVHFRVKRGTGAGIARFYREIFGAEAEEIGRTANAGETTCSVVGGTDGEARAVGAVVQVGPVQHLGFVEADETLPDYDGHHICVYLTDKDFRRSFVEADRRGLVFVNPRRNFGKADTLEKALAEKQYRVKDMVDPASGELLHVLEHEIRSVSHPSYPVGRDLAVET